MSTFVLTAGGTGGHLFPAEALARELIARGHRIVVLTDTRGASFAGAFAGAKIVTVPSAALSGGKLKLLVAPFKILAGLVASIRHLKAARPKVVIGFGGYPTVPPMLAANLLHLTTVIVSPDALLGRANRLLMNRVDVIAANLPLVRFLPKNVGKIVCTGNPLRPEVEALAPSPYRVPQKNGPFDLLVFGGSQGARFFSEIMPAAVALLPEFLRARLNVVQQCRPEDIESVRAAYARLNVAAELAPFFKDMPARMAYAHLTLARSGAGTVSELAAIGRPAILVPLPFALDDNQTPNADALVDVGAAWRVAQKDLSPVRLAGLLTEAMAGPDDLVRRSAAALRLAKPQAAKVLADLVEGLENPNA